MYTILQNVICQQLLILLCI